MSGIMSYQKNRREHDEVKLHERLRQLRMRENLTQGQVAEYLCVSAQSVSKWERGLVEPDLQTLPRLATLYHTSTDALPGMNRMWEASDHRRFRASLKEAYYQRGDKEGTWNLLVNQVALHPDDYDLYIWLMLLAYRAQMCTPVKVNIGSRSPAALRVTVAGWS